MATPSLHILHCLAPAPFGGLERVVQLLATGQARRGHCVTVAAITEEDDHPFVQTLAGSGVEVRTLRIGGRAYHRERRTIRHLIHAERINVLHSHGYRPDILDLEVARHCERATVTTLHGFTGGDWKVKLYERLQMRAIREADAVIAVSQGVYARAQRGGVSVNRLHLIPNAYAATTPVASREEARRALGFDDAAMHMAWIGRLSEEKGPDVMVEAMMALRDVPVMLSMIGDGPDAATLQARASTTGVGTQIRWHGIVPDAARVLPAFDAFVLSSRTEGTPIVVLEAMAAGVPIVATCVGGIPQMLNDDEAELVPPEDPPALAAAIRRVFEDPARARARAVRARARLDRDFGLEQWLDRHDTLYHSLCR